MPEISFNCSDCGGEHSINEALVNKVADRLIDEVESLIQDSEVASANAVEKDEIADDIIANSPDWSEDDRLELRSTPVSVLEDLKDSTKSQSRSVNFSAQRGSSANLSTEDNDSSGFALTANDRLNQIDEEN